jgi:anaerobic selenocysteine-containing dehydrogenase
VLIDSLPNSLMPVADVVLPAATWVEKAGTFENVHNLLQAFEPAIQPLEFARPEAQIALDLAAAAGLADPQRFSAAETRRQMGGPFTADIVAAAEEHQRTSDIEYVEI